ncbi:MAG: transporter [Candidatus Scalinduaceae bacterium]
MFLVSISGGEMKLYHFSILFMFICLICETSVNPLIAGGPPLVTDDTGTPGHNKWEINLAYTRTNTIHEKTTDFTVDANYGLGERTQLNLMIPYTYIDNDEDGKASHIGDIQLATKYRFLDETDWLFSVSVTPTISLPTDSHRSKPDFFLPLEFDRNIKNLYVGSQVGYTIHQEKGVNNELFYGFFGEYPVSEKIDVVGEVSGFFVNHEKANSPQFNTGLRYRFSDFLSVMGSAGTSFEEGAVVNQIFLGTLGIRFNF